MFKDLNIKDFLKIENLKLKIRVSLLIFVLLITFSPLLSKNVLANSSYVLPYPSFMPGSKFYTISVFIDEIKKYWYFGDFAQFEYNLQQSDKYLVEARTLFDYKQHFLAYQALQKSDNFFKKIGPTISSAKRNGKNTTDENKILKEAAQKHIEELEKLKNILPSILDWKPEKKEPQTLKLLEAFENSIRIREEVL